MKHFIARTLSKTPFLYKAYDKIVPRAEVHFKNSNLEFETHNTLMKARIDTFFSKEPQTLKWLDKMSVSDTLLDIGGNIGLYSLYAAKICGLSQVIAIEPESQNYAQLNRHIFLNGSQSNLKAYNIALSDKTEFTTLNLSRFSSGDSHHQVAHNALADSGTFSQGIFAITLNDFCKLLNFCPSHIKIDVDGHETAILKGADKVLQNTALKSILIESETSQQSSDYSEILKCYGFEISEKHLLPNTKNAYNLVYSRG